MSITTTEAPQVLTVDQYVEIERESGVRHEYRNGDVTQVVGETRSHALISGNLFVQLRSLALAGDGEVYQSDMRVQVNQEPQLTYPDVVVSDGTPKFTKPTDTLTNPLLIAEVLSQSTEAYDRGDKFEQYSRIPSFKEYLLIAQDKVSVTHFVRQPDNNWLRMSYQQKDEEISLQSMDGKLSVSDIYLQVSFSDESNAK